MPPADQLSKSAIKREMLALQAIGEQLTTLSSSQLARIELPSDLREAIHQAGVLKSHEARRRHMQYIGKLMRRVDTEPLLAALEAINQHHQKNTNTLHALESLRDRLIAEGDPAIEHLLQQWPTADRSRLRQLVRAARCGEATTQRGGRKLYRYLATLQAEHPENSALSSEQHTR